jgi:hypothetical protein
VILDLWRQYIEWPVLLYLGLSSETDWKRDREVMVLLSASLGVELMSLAHFPILCEHHAGNLLNSHVMICIVAPTGNSRQPHSHGSHRNVTCKLSKTAVRIRHASSDAECQDFASAPGT